MHVVIYSKAEGKQYGALFRYCCHTQCTVTWQTKSETVKKPASCAASSLKCYWLNLKSLFTWNRCVLQLMFLCWGRDCFWWSAWDSRKKRDYVTIRRTGGTCWSNCTPSSTPGWPEQEPVNNACATFTWMHWKTANLWSLSIVTTVCRYYRQGADIQRPDRQT